MYRMHFLEIWMKNEDFHPMKSQKVLRLFWNVLIYLKILNKYTYYKDCFFFNFHQRFKFIDEYCNLKRDLIESVPSKYLFSLTSVMNLRCTLSLDKFMVYDIGALFPLGHYGYLYRAMRYKGPVVHSVLGLRTDVLEIDAEKYPKKR